MKNIYFINYLTNIVYIDKIIFFVKQQQQQQLHFNLSSFYYLVFKLSCE
jgi:hypothetical protein